MARLVIIALIAQLALAQDTQPGAPYSQVYGTPESYPVTYLPDVDNQRMIDEDLDRLSPAPYRYGYIHQTSLSADSSGRWADTADGGRVWQIAFTSGGAYSLSLGYEDFYIPLGGELYVYSPGYGAVYGAYTHHNNTEHQYFSTPHIKGDTVVIEYYEPSWADPTFSLEITEVVHDYRDIMNFYSGQRDWECGTNVICEDAPEYQGPINSVAFLDMGGWLCTGAMVNNVRQDLTPYFLTAYHCTEGENPNTFRFYFNKETSSCENTWASGGEYAYSSQQVADSQNIWDADWALLLITDDIDEEWDVYYSGWDATGEYPIISTSVHHPNGTAKKINYDDDQAWGDWWTGGSSNILTHWKVNWDEGGTTGGSSGSPLFDDQFRYVGVLTGGNADCLDDETGQNYYGKMSFGWDGPFASSRKVDWLDPDSTGTLVIDGTYVVVDTIEGDLNGDEVVNIQDIILIVNVIISGTDNTYADLNGDGIVNIIDIIHLVNIITG